MTPPQPGHQFDPMTFSQTLGSKTVLLISALWDEYFPTKVVNEFWEAIGRPERLSLPATHASIWFYYPLISREISRFFRRNLLRPKSSVSTES